MKMSDKYLEEQLRETLKVVDTCLECIYRGQPHMYRCLAGQLRILLYDSNRNNNTSLLSSVYPTMLVSAMRPIEWKNGHDGPVVLDQPPGANLRTALMPFEITKYTNDLVVADVLLDDQRMLPIGDWMNQLVTVHPTTLTIWEVVRHVADKGGGAHVDADASPELRYLSRKVLLDQTYAAIFVLAVGRFVQQIGEKLFDYTGCQVPVELLQDSREIFRLHMVAHGEWAEARKDGYSQAELMERRSANRR